LAIEDRHQKAVASTETASGRALPKEGPSAADGEFRAACQELLVGYGDALDPKHGGTGRRPFILAEDERTAWLRDIVINKLQGSGAKSEFTEFLKTLKDLPQVEGDVPESAWVALRRSLPDGAQGIRMGRRAAGLGSL